MGGGSRKLISVIHCSKVCEKFGKFLFIAWHNTGRIHTPGMEMAYKSQKVTQKVIQAEVPLPGCHVGPMVFPSAIEE